MTFPLSKKILGFQGENPFRETQAKSFRDSLLTQEFFPTTLFWSLFNEQHEVLLGTRGSGKTILLRMLSYSFLRNLNHPNVKEIKEKKKFIGFYIPMHLEFVSALPGRDIPAEEKLEYFQFAFNCLAATSLLYEVRLLLADTCEDMDVRLQKEAEICVDLRRLWFGDACRVVRTIEDLAFEITVLWETTPFWKDGECGGKVPPFSRPVLDPIKSAIQRVSQIIGLDFHNSTWIACIDEAEFLREPYLRCINDFMRSEKRPLVIKLATLPYRHSTLDTLEEGVKIEPNGNDFSYNVVDMQIDSPDYLGLCDHLLRSRLKRCGIDIGAGTLDDFLGRIGGGDQKDYFLNELADEYPSDDILLTAIVASLSERRQERYARLKPTNPARISSDYLKRFSPVFYARRTKSESRHGNRTVGWFAGAETVRRVADGNPRRFLQLVSDLFEMARTSELSPKNQHRVIVAFSRRHFEYASGLPMYGFFLQSILETIGAFLARRVHGQNMVDGGCHFRLSESLLRDELFIRAIHLGIAYSLLFCDSQSLCGKINEASDLRLAYLCAVHFWLPMRKGDPVLIRTKRAEELFSADVGIPESLDRETSARLVRQLALEFQEHDEEK